MHLVAVAHVVVQASGAGLGRFLARRLLLHGLLRTGGWVLVLLVIVALVVVSQINRRRR